VETVASAELKRAQTLETLGKVDQTAQEMAIEAQDNNIKIMETLVPPGQNEPTPGTTIMVEPSNG
jgi:hypothetical protein